MKRISPKRRCLRVTERDLSELGDSLANPDEDDSDGSAEPSEGSSEEPQSETTTRTGTQTGGQIEETESGDTVDQVSTEAAQSREKVGDVSEDTSPSQCQETTRDGTQCDHDAQLDSLYCKKHQPNNFGYRPGDFERKQWNLLPEVLDELFDDSVTSDSLFIAVQRETNKSFQKKSIENLMGEFLLENREEFIEFVSREFDDYQ